MVQLIRTGHSVTHQGKTVNKHSNLHGAYLKHSRVTIIVITQAA
uniref:Uncharacterized protein n=1 Tax=Timema douglasi TaxID=61478 RepID=A0A7R8VYT5_TIMDO|nr:unnamed protein product [Timema douglasi]